MKYKPAAGIFKEGSQCPLCMGNREVLSLKTTPRPKSNYYFKKKEHSLQNSTISILPLKFHTVMAIQNSSAMFKFIVSDCLFALTAGN